MGQGYLKEIWGKALGCGEGSARPVKLKGDKTTDPGGPSYSQPLPDIYGKKPRFSPNGLQLSRRENQVCLLADLSGKRPTESVPWGHSTLTLSRQARGSGAHSGVGCNHAQLSTILRHTSEWETETVRYSAEPVQGQISRNPRRPPL